MVNLVNGKAMSTAANSNKSDTGNRIIFLDNLRSFMIFLVVVLHAGLVYEYGIFSTFIWVVADPSTNQLVGPLRIILDIFIMSTIFFVSGYFAPISLERKRPLQFIYGKFKRLMIPWAIAVLTLVPLYKVVFLYSRHLPQQEWWTYFHWSNGIWGQNWLWFLPVLFLFDILFVFVAKFIAPLTQPSLKKAVGAVFLVGLSYSIGMDVFGLQGWTKSILLDFQNERLIIYFLMFLLGARCFSLNVFESAARNKRQLNIVLSTGWIAVYAYYYFYFNIMSNTGSVVIQEAIDTIMLWLSFHLSLFYLLILLIYTFKKYLGKSGKIIEVINAGSYHVYIIHVVVMGALAMLLLRIEIPSVLKFFLLTICTFAASNLIVYGYQRLMTVRM